MSVTEAPVAQHQPPVWRRSRACRRRRHAAARAERRHRRRAVPLPRVGAARHRGALRGQGQPAPRPAARARAGRVPFRRREPGRGAARARRRRRPPPPRALQPRRAARPPRAGPRPRGAPVRRRLPGRGRQGGRRRTRLLGARAGGHLRLGVGLAAVAEVRLHGRRGRRAAASGPPAAGSTPPGCPSTSGRSSATRTRGARRSARPHGCSTRCGPPASARGCSTSAAGSPPTLDGGVRSGRRLRPRHRRAPHRGLRRTTARRPSSSPAAGSSGDAGTVVDERRRRRRPRRSRWVFLDAGVFTGLVETLDEAIRYRLETPGVDGPTGPCVLAGPDLRQRRRALRDDAGRTCRSRSPRATRCASTRPGRTRRATRPWASTASRRCPPSSPAEGTDASPPDRRARASAAGIRQARSRNVQTHTWLPSGSASTVKDGASRVVDDGAPGGDRRGDPRLGRPPARPTRRGASADGAPRARSVSWNHIDGIRPVGSKTRVLDQRRRWFP